MLHTLALAHTHTHIIHNALLSFYIRLLKHIIIIIQLSNHCSDSDFEYFCTILRAVKISLIWYHHQCFGGSTYNVWAQAQPKQTSIFYALHEYGFILFVCIIGFFISVFSLWNGMKWKTLVPNKDAIHCMIYLYMTIESVMSNRQRRTQN